MASQTVRKPKPMVNPAASEAIWMSLFEAMDPKMNHGFKDESWMRENRGSCMKVDFEMQQRGDL